MTQLAIYILPFVLSFAALSQAQPLSEVLGRPTDVSVTLNLLFDYDADVVLQSGTRPDALDSRSDTLQARAGLPLVHVIERLAPDTRHYYRSTWRRAGAGQFASGPVRTFHTQRARGRIFRFGIIADSHLYDKKGIPEMMRSTMRSMAADELDFVLDLGDTFGDDHEPFTITAAEIDKLHRDFLPYVGMVCHSAPLFLCLGNHEGESGYYLLQTPPNNIAVHGTLARKKYFSNPVPDRFYTGNSDAEPYGMGLPENYYSWEWGDAQFIVLDAYRASALAAKAVDWDWTLGARQYEWLRNTLRNSTARYRFVFAHHVSGEGRGAAAQAPLFEWGGSDKKGRWGFDSNRPGWEAPVHQLFVRYGVQVFFQGHDHLFAQETLDGVVYQETPMPSDSTYTIGTLANADAYLSNQREGSGYLRVLVAGDSALVEYVRCLMPKDTSAARPSGFVDFSYTVAARVLGIENNSTVPGSAFLRAYPNPTTEVSHLTFELPACGAALLRIHDVMGRHVATLCETSLPAGRHERQWDGRGLDGAPVPPGAYICVLQTAAALSTHVLIRR